MSTFQSRRYAPALPHAPTRRWSCADHDGDAAMNVLLPVASVAGRSSSQIEAALLPDEPIVRS